MDRAAGRPVVTGCDQRAADKALLRSCAGRVFRPLLERVTMIEGSTLDAPAKLNLSLRVLGQRPDGYHEVETMMVRLPALADRLQVEAAEAFSFACDDPSLPLDEGNLVVRAVREYERAAGVTVQARILLEKRVPHGAGLGGGSSDAAAALVLVERLHGGLLGAERLGEIAAGLGSDVVYFLGRGPAWCRGRGERVEAAAGVPALPVVLLKPWFGVSTPDAYGRWQDAAKLPGIGYGPQGMGWGSMINDLERPVFAKHLFLAEMKEWLRSRREVAAALMSGSGSTMFAVLKDAAAAEGLIAAAREQLDPTLWAWAGWTEGAE